jgi:hypothetical protein
VPFLFDTISFCTFGFFHILYVDSLVVDNVDIPATTPRIAAWSRSLIDQVLKMDTNRDGSFGKLKVWLITFAHFKNEFHVANLHLLFLS